MPVRVLEGVHLWTLTLLPALGSSGLMVLYGTEVIGKLLMFGFVPVLVFHNFEFAFHRTPRSTLAALGLALAVPAELALTHALFGDTPQLFFADLFLVELLGLFVAMVLFMWLDRDGSVDREWIAAFVVLLALGVPLVVWVVLPFWRGRIDDPLWLVGIAIGVVIGVIMRVVSLGNIPSSGEEFAAPWMRRGFALWVVAVLVTFYAT